MKISSSLRRLAVRSLILFLILTILSGLFSLYKSAEYFDAIFEIGFPWKFYVNGGFFNTLTFYPTLFLLYSAFILGILLITSKIYDKHK
jgi:hypothetical protein